MDSKLIYSNEPSSCVLFSMISFVSCDDLIDDDLIALEKLVCRFNEWISNHSIISIQQIDSKWWWTRRQGFWRYIYSNLLVLNTLNEKRIAAVWYSSDLILASGYILSKGREDNCKVRNGGLTNSISLLGAESSVAVAKPFCGHSKFVELVPHSLYFLLKEMRGPQMQTMHKS